MNKIKTIIATLFVLTTCNAIADTLELADGTLLEGDFIGSSNGIIMFDTGGGIEAFMEDKVVALYLSAGVETAQKMDKETITVPAGTRLIIRTTDPIDSSRHQAGHRFRGQLEGALVVNGNTIAPRGAYVHGQIKQAASAGRLAGSAELSITFTDIMIDNQLFPISTGRIESQTGSEAARTFGRTARAAAIGGLIGGRSGARTGAQVGVGASILTSGASINIPPGTILETTLTAPLEIQK